MQNNDFFKTILSIIKAIGKKDDVKINFFDAEDDFFAFNQNFIEEKSLSLPKGAITNNHRALSDLSAGYFLFHDKKLHQNLRRKNFDQDQLSFFDDFEKIRVAVNISQNYAGIRKNIVEKIIKDTKSSLQFTPQSALTLFLLDDQELSEIAQNSFNLDENAIKKVRKLSENLQNQEEFALQVKEILDFIKKQEEEQQKEEEKQTKQNQQEQKQEDPSTNQENIESQPIEQQESESQKPQDEQKQTVDSQKLQDDAGGKIQARAPQDNASDYEEKLEFKPLYKIFTNKFDEIVLPQKLVDKSELEVLRYSLDIKIDKLEAISKRLTLKLKRKLLAKRNISVEQSEDEGVLDRKKFSQLVIDPFLQNFFVTQKQHEYQDTVVTILIDNSGSMRGSPIVMAAMASEIIASILEKFAIKTEILGFTTMDWKGGKSRKLWESQGREPSPGRLNDLRHIIYKSANQSFKKAKVNLGFMLKEGVLKENIDGEALLWAKSRLMQREEKRKILVIISDGTPVDDSTNSTNSQEILVDHLHHVIKKIEKEGKIEMVGIGIGHNVGEFYTNAISIKKPEELGDVMIEKIVNLI